MFNILVRSICRLVFVVFLISELSYAQDSISKVDVSNLVEKITQYEYGKDRAPVFEFDEILTNSINKKQNLDYLEDKLIEVIKNKSTLDGKRFACQLLSKFATSKSIDPLLKLLNNNSTADMARYALEKIDSDKVDDKLLKIIGDSDDLTKIGIINTLAVRKFHKAINVISNLSKSKDVKLSSAAISALGKIGGQESESKLKELLKNSDGNLINETSDALLVIADNYLNEDEISKSLDIYQIIYSDKRLTSQRTAALKGIVLAAPNSSFRDSIITSALMDENMQIQQVGLSSIKMVSETADGNSITKNFNQFSDNAKISALARIKDGSLIYYADFVRKILNESLPKIQIAAIECLQSIGNPEDVNLFLKIAVGTKSQLKNSSRQALYGIKGKEVEEKIINLVSSSNPEEKIELINAVKERKIVSAFPVIYNEATNSNQRVRVASYRALGEISQFNDLGKLMNIFSNITDTRELKPFENSLAKISLSHNKKDERASVFLKVIDKTSEHEKKMTLLRILGATGDVNAYNKIKIYLEDNIDEVKKVAIQSLYNWPNIEPKEQLIDIIKYSDNETHKTLALRSYVNLLKEHATEDEGVTDYYKEILPSAEKLNELPLVISGIATISTLKSLEFATQFLDNSKIQSESELAVLNIIENGGWDFPSESLRALDKLIKNSKDKEIIKRAEDIKLDIENEL